MVVLPEPEGAENIIILPAMVVLQFSIILQYLKLVVDAFMGAV